jgi:hypothetical protein
MSFPKSERWVDKGMSSMPSIALVQSSPCGSFSLSNLSTLPPSTPSTRWKIITVTVTPGPGDYEVVPAKVEKIDDSHIFGAGKRFEDLKTITPGTMKSDDGG